MHDCLKALRRLGVALMHATLLACCFVAGLGATYVSADGDVDEARVAMLGFELADDQSARIVDLRDITKPGDTATYRFVIRNSGEVSTSYRLCVALAGSMPLVCRITEEGGSEPVLVTTLDQLDSAIASNEVPMVAMSEPLDPVVPNTSQAQTYVLEVRWPSDDESNRDYGTNVYQHYEGASAELTLRVVCEQVD